MVDISRFKAAVFDMDGVVVDTEPFIASTS